jgi:pimeloyl-ACP methyl ester carboxylesterase
VRLAGGSAIKAAAAIAPSPVPLAKLAEEQARRRLNPDAPDFAAEFEDHPVMIALRKAKETKEEFTVIGGKPVYLDVFRQWQTHDPEADFKAAKTPVLYLVAGKDQQVFPELSKALVRSLGKREGYSQKTFEDVDHFLVKSRGTIGSYSDPDRRLDPEAVAYLVRWLATAF